MPAGARLIKNAASFCRHGGHKRPFERAFCVAPYAARAHQAGQSWEKVPAAPGQRREIRRKGKFSQEKPCGKEEKTKKKLLRSTSCSCPLLAFHPIPAPRWRVNDGMCVGLPPEWMAAFHQERIRAHIPVICRQIRYAEGIPVPVASERPAPSSQFPIMPVSSMRRGDLAHHSSFSPLRREREKGKLDSPLFTG